MPLMTPDGCAVGIAKPLPASPPGCSARCGDLPSAAQRYRELEQQQADAVFNPKVKRPAAYDIDQAWELMTNAERSMVRALPAAQDDYDRGLAARPEFGSVARLDTTCSAFRSGST